VIKMSNTQISEFTEFAEWTLAGYIANKIHNQENLGDTSFHYCGKN
jgi:hypothetical protein